MSNQISLLIDGQKFDGYTEISVERSIEEMCGSFSLSTTIKETEDRVILNPLKVQAEVSVLIDDVLWLTGRIENLTVSYDSDSHSIQCSGRDKTGDLVDSSIIQLQYSERNFIRLLEKVLADNGYSDIEVIDSGRNITGDLISTPTIPSNEFIRTESGDTIFSFIDRYAQRLQLFVLTDEKGNLVVSSEGSEGAGGALVSVKGGKENNILSASLSVNSTDRFRFVEVYSQSGNDTFTKTSISQKGSSGDSQISSNRRKIIIAGKATQKKVLDQIAQWNVVVRRAKGQRYNCSVAGFYTGRNNGELWTINTIVQVSDDKCDMNGAYLVEGVKFTKSISGGSITELSIVEIGSFSIDPQQKFNFSSQSKRKLGNTSYFKSAT